MPFTQHLLYPRLRASEKLVVERYKEIVLNDLSQMLWGLGCFLHPWPSRNVLHFYRKDAADGERLGYNGEMGR